ncbi:PepSY domain-containing protein [Lampropedia puyangensis]|uniref:PepSY domain-containing protein n=1 Tax=Lampropedia puyangensis TaxID=1330072 RepID=A0A4V6T2R5_9BURK|nr:PepSY domain-containing protein [Lampropedia puyangensis]THU02476.1 PepSY domain-containing protein [Lampropedia puyangensis]
MNFNLKTASIRSVNRFKPLAVGLVAATLGLGSATWAADNARQAWDTLNAQGYVAIDDLKREHGLWTAKGTTWDGKRVHLMLDANDQLLEVGRPEAQHNLATAQQVVQHLQNLGYQRVRDVELDDGFWEAEANNLAGFEVDLTLHPVSLAVLSEVVDGMGQAVPGVGNDVLSAAQVRSVLEAAGYTRIHDLDFEDGYWDADATNPVGQRVELRLDSKTGAVLREKLDD